MHGGRPCAAERRPPSGHWAQRCDPRGRMRWSPPASVASCADLCRFRPKNARKTPALGGRGDQGRDDMRPRSRHPREPHRSCRTPVRRRARARGAWRRRRRCSAGRCAARRRPPHTRRSALRRGTAPAVGALGAAMRPAWEDAVEAPRIGRIARGPLRFRPKNARKTPALGGRGDQGRDDMRPRSRHPREPHRSCRTPLGQAPIKSGAELGSSFA